VVAAALFLASDQAAATTGTHLVVDAGRPAGGSADAVLRAPSPVRWAR